MKIVGRRSIGVASVVDQGRLARTVMALRGGRGLAPRGVYRFTSYEMASRWLTQMMLRSREPRSPKTSSASADR